MTSTEYQIFIKDVVGRLSKLPDISSGITSTEHINKTKTMRIQFESFEKLEAFFLEFKPIMERYGFSSKVIGKVILIFKYVKKETI